MTKAERARRIGCYIRDNNATVRQAAKEFGLSKSTVHYIIMQDLRGPYPKLYGEVRLVMEINKAECHIRGGAATRIKYKGEVETT